MESFELHFGLVLNGKRMNQNAKPHKRSLVVGDQNGIRVLGLCCFVSEEFDHNDLTSIGNIVEKITIRKRLYIYSCRFETRSRAINLCGHSDIP